MSVSTTARACLQARQTSLLTSLPYRDPSTMFQRRQFFEPDLELTIDLAMYILRSYLHVIANQYSVPPFIHPKYQIWMEAETHRPSPLYAAIKLAKMPFLGRGTNRTLIWSLIRMEQARLLHEVRTTVSDSAFLILIHAFTHSTSNSASGRFLRRSRLSFFMSSCGSLRDLMTIPILKLSY